MNLPKNNNRKSTRKYNNKMPNKSFNKTVENKYMGLKKNLIKGYNFNKNSLINNSKLKIPKCKLSLEIESKRKTYQNKEYQSLLDAGNNKQKNIKNKILSPKLKKLNINLEQIKKKEIFKNSNKEKLIKKRLEKK